MVDRGAVGAIVAIATGAAQRPIAAGVGLLREANSRASRSPDLRSVMSFPRGLNASESVAFAMAEKPLMALPAISSVVLLPLAARSGVPPLKLDRESQRSSFHAANSLRQL